MSIEADFYQTENDHLYEEQLLRNPYSLNLWWNYLIAQTESPFTKRSLIYERALKSLPGSYKLWLTYLLDRLEFISNSLVSDIQYEMLNNTFERALVTMHRMPRIWIMYLTCLNQQKLLTRTRKAFDRALCSLPVTQHARIWEHCLEFVTQKGVPAETSVRVYRRYLKYDPCRVEDFIEFLLNSGMWQDSAEKLGRVLNDDRFYSIKGKTKHANEISGLNVEAIIKSGINKFTDEVGRLRTSLADYYIRKNLLEKARDVFEESMTKVLTVGDFSVNFDAYYQFEESLLALKMEEMSVSEDEEEAGKKFWLCDEKDFDLRIARLENLIDRRLEVANSVLLRQNPHNVEQWHKRVKIFEGNLTKQILTYTGALKTVDPMKAVGKPHTLWVAFAKLYETNNDIVNARVKFEKAVQMKYKSVDNLASV